MRKKRWLIVILLINIFMVLTMPSTVLATKEESVQVYDEEKYQEIFDESQEEIEGLYDYINSTKTDVELMNELDPYEYVKTYIKEGEGNISSEKLIKAILSLIFKEVATVLKLCLSLIVVGVLCALIKNLQQAFNNKGVSEVAFYACFIILIMLLSKSFVISIQVAKDIITDISNFMNVLLPILVTMISLSGGVMQATTLDPVILAAVTIIPKIYLSIIIPGILISFVLQFANNLTEDHKIGNLCKMVKRWIMWLQGIILTAFIALLTIRGITSSTMDAVTLKTTKYAVDNFIPIVGKAFSDAITSVAAYSLIIKNAISTIGLVTIVLMILYPIIKIVLMSFIYKLSASLLEPISDKRITASIVAAGDSLIVLLSCVLCVSLMFFVLIAIMASANSFVIGV